jgi:hypothetical protein
MFPPRRGYGMILLRRRSGRDIRVKIIRRKRVLKTRRFSLMGKSKGKKKDMRKVKCFSWHKTGHYTVNVKTRRRERRMHRYQH